MSEVNFTPVFQATTTFGGLRRREQGTMDTITTIVNDWLAMFAYVGAKITQLPTTDDRKQWHVQQGKHAGTVSVVPLEAE